jgi:hypothetical protein
LDIVWHSFDVIFITAGRWRYSDCSYGGGHDKAAGRSRYGDEKDRGKKVAEEEERKKKEDEEKEKEKLQVQNRKNTAATLPVQPPSPDDDDDEEEDGAIESNARLASSAGQGEG